ncbi:MAG: ZIP family metal transporter [Candidatus Aenigmarchaeota archaeon]|nr:ZIP family metal transporter [Candidatus Aenigmarchaeota archaeon]
MRSKYIAIIVGIFAVAFFLNPPMFSFLIPQPLGGTILPEISIYRMEFREGVIVAKVMNTGPVDVDIGAVQVGGPHPAGLVSYVIDNSHVPRLGHSTIKIPYDWTEGLPYKVKLVISDGTAFESSAIIASLTPSFGIATLWTSILLGLYIGVIPVLLGMLPFDAFRKMKKDWITFFSAFSAGVLAFLLIDTVHEGSEFAARLPIHLGPVIFIGGIAAGVAILVYISKTRGGKGEKTPFMISYLIALGIGVHNLGEGLAVGASFAQGLASLGTLLVVGFALHNLSEGIAIMSPLLSEQGSLKQKLLEMGLIAGIPTILGVVLGFSFYSDALATLFFGLAAAAILYVVVEILRHAPKSEENWLYSGILAGFFAMYITGALVKLLVG